jgi:polysaccharide biosynthesis protein VpsQ
MTQSITSILRPLATLAAAGFVVFFIWIVMIADRGNGTPWWSFIDRIPCGDKVGHLGLIGTLSFLCNLAFPSRKSGFLPRIVTLTTVVLLVLLSMEELSQGFIKTRHLDFYDWLADLAGLALGQFGAMRMRGHFLKLATAGE